MAEHLGWNISPAPYNGNFKIAVDPSKLTQGACDHEHTQVLNLPLLVPGFLVTINAWLLPQTTRSHYKSRDRH